MYTVSSSIHLFTKFRSQFVSKTSLIFSNIIQRKISKFSQYYTRRTIYYSRFVYDDI